MDRFRNGGHHGGNRPTRQFKEKSTDPDLLMEGLLCTRTFQVLLQDCWELYRLPSFYEQRNQGSEN